MTVAAGQLQAPPATSVPAVVSADKAVLSVPSGIAIDTQGHVYMSDTGNSVLRELSCDTGIADLMPTSPTATFELTNTGTAPLTIESILITGQNPSSFSQTSTCPSQVDPGGSCQITANFTAAAGALGNIEIATNAPSSPTNISLVGSVTGGPQLIAPATLDFGTVTGSPAVQTVTIVNAGGATLTVQQIGISGASEFTAAASSCIGPLLPSAECQIPITFVPGSTASSVGPRSATLTITSDAPGSPLSVALTATVAGTAKLSSTVNSMNFGALPTGSAGSTQMLTILNSGSSSVTIGQIEISGASEFTAVGSSCIGPLLPSAECQIPITFLPGSTATSVGPRSATLTVTSDATPAISVALTAVVSGAPAPQLAITPSTLNFTLPIGNTLSQTVSVSNSGSAPATVQPALSSNSLGFALTSSCPTLLAVGANCTVTVTFTAKSSAPQTAIVNVSADRSFTVSGSGLQNSWATFRDPLIQLRSEAVTVRVPDQVSNSLFAFTPNFSAVPIPQPTASASIETAGTSASPNDSTQQPMASSADVQATPSCAADRCPDTPPAGDTPNSPAAAASGTGHAADSPRRSDSNQGKLIRRVTPSAPVITSDSISMREAAACSPVPFNASGYDFDPLPSESTAVLYDGSR
ncbi:MAG: choice-of-anchor D domain-containing protein [Acidobacteriaceae bacterium]|nr:choice-of-anchor D domain-containing protein [Acidobacteriaceae bacterium]